MKRIRWTREELILVLDLYFKHKERLDRVSAETLEEYSYLLRTININVTHGNESFRSPDSIYLRLQNYLSCDPYWQNRGRKGLQSRKSGDFRKIWAEFHECPEVVAELAAEIKRSILRNNYAAFSSMSETHRSPVIEGKKQLRIHYSRERKPQRQKKIGSFITAHGHLFCECCGTTADKYEDTIRERVFEVHHDVPLALASKQVETKIEDLSVLCASCHRAIHGYEVVPSVKDLRKMIQSD